MEEVLFKYKDQIENIDFEFNQKYLMDVAIIHEPDVIDPSKAYKAILKKPVNSLPLSERLSSNDRVVIIVSDITRDVPTKDIFPYLMEELLQAGIKYENITVLIALGVHKKNTIKEIESIIGKKWSECLRIKNHNAFDFNELVYLGDTSHKTPVWVNKEVVAADFCIAIGKIEPHEFAGFTGGAKSILPGVCAEETIKINHKPELILHENCKPGLLVDNIIREDMNEAAKIAGLDFIINVVLNKEGNLLAAFAGDPYIAHEEGCKFLKDFIKIEIDESPDIIITSPGKPLNINLYQSLKAIIALEPIICSKTKIIFYSSCRDGLGSNDMLQPFISNNSIDFVIDKIKGDYTIEKDHSLLLANILSKGVEIFAYSPNIKLKDFITLRMKPIKSVQLGIKLALESIGFKKVPKILIYQMPQRSIPIIKQKN